MYYLKFEYDDECNGLTAVQQRWVANVMESCENDQESQHIFAQLLVDTNALPNTVIQN